MIATMARKPAKRNVKRLTDPRALRALAHPIRLELVGLLRRRGPLTATQAAELLGESSGSTSFHLRQLAKYGLVEAAGGGTGRERPWQATAMFTGWPDVANNPELEAASGLLRGVIAERYFEQLLRWLESHDTEPAEWQEAAQFGDTLLWVTTDELLELGREEQALMDRYLDRQTKPELRPPGARLISYLHLAFPAESDEAQGDAGGRRN
jgi:DNA-binding transcriptional ArsR family regulator